MITVIESTVIFNQKKYEQIKRYYSDNVNMLQPITRNELRNKILLMEKCKEWLIWKRGLQE